MKKVFLLLLCGFVFSTNIKAQQNDKPIHNFSLEDCVGFAKKNNVQVKNSLLAIEAQIQTNREIRSAALPTINSSFSTFDIT